MPGRCRVRRGFTLRNHPFDLVHFAVRVEGAGEVRPYVSDPADLVLHGPRVLGFASSEKIAAQFGLEREFTDELLLGFEARGWLTHSAFAGSTGWSVTDLSLTRFDGYAARYNAALAKVDAGQRRWIDSPELDSCHTVWIQFHEDLLATLGLPRGSDT